MERDGRKAGHRGGSVVFLVLPDADPGLGESLARAYAQATNRVPRVLLP